MGTWHEDAAEAMLDIDNLNILDVVNEVQFCFAADLAGTGEAVAVVVARGKTISVDIDRDDLRRLAEWCAQVLDAGRHA